MEIRKFLYLEKKKKENFPSWINKKQRGYNDSYASKKIYFSISVPLDPNIFIYPFKGYSCGISTIYLFLENCCKITEIRGFRFGDRKSMVGTVRIGNFTVTGIGKSASFIAEYFQREWIVMSRSSTWTSLVFYEVKKPWQ